MSDFNRYSKLIEDGVFFSEDNAVKDLVISRLGGAASASLIFKLVNEILRLRKKTTLPYRVTAYVASLSPGALVTEQHNGLEHVFDKQTYQRFQRLMKKSGQCFTVFIYEALVDFSKAHIELIEQTDVDAGQLVNVVDVSEPIYRKEERMHLGYRVTVFEYNSEVEPSQNHPAKVKGETVTVGVTQNISQNGAKLKATIPPKKEAYYILHIIDIDKEFVFNQPLIIYQCKGFEMVKREGEVYYYWSMMKVEHPAHVEFDGFLKTFIFANRARYRVDLMNVERATTNHIVEQFLTNRSQAFSAYFSKDDTPLVTFGASHALPFMAELKTEKGRDALCDLIEKDGLHRLANGRSGLWYGIRRRSGFYTTLLDPDDPLTVQYLSFVLRHESGFVYHVHCRELRGAKPYIKQSIPSEVQKKRVKLRANDHYSEHTKALVDKVGRVVQFTPLPKDAIAALLPESDEGKGDPRFNQLLLNAVRVRKVPFIKARQNELRSEDRFSIDMHCIIDVGKQRYSGIIKDISIQGVAIYSPDIASLLSAREKVVVQFSDILQDELPLRVRYEVVSSDAKQSVVRLKQVEGTEGSSSYAIESYLVKNLGSILPQQSAENQVLPDKYSGLDRALRNLHNQHAGISEGIFHIRKGMGYVSHVNLKPELISLISNTVSVEEMHVNDQETLKAFFFQPSLKVMLAEGLRESTLDAPYGYRFAFFQYDSDGIYSVRCVKPDAMARPTWRMQEKEARRSGRELRVAMIRITRKSRVFDYYYRDEMAYVSAVAAHKGEALKELVKGTMGVVSFYPIPASVLRALK